VFGLFDRVEPLFVAQLARESPLNGNRATSPAAEISGSEVVSVASLRTPSSTARPEPSSQAVAGTAPIPACESTRGGR
jgi:hypothetical protein